ncbi:MAG: methionine--tRNA ligase [Bacteroidota bacterium]|nr:methionine--tRNA ligase [Bacteroidota bacterium]
MPNAKRTLVTAALPYANGPIHIGHLAGVYVPADMYVRFKRLRGEEVLFICGSDEHGVPITISADKEKVSPKVIVDRYHELNKQTFENLGISFDYYGRTSSDEHRIMAQEFFLRLLENGFIETKEEPQLYDAEAKMFLPDRYVEGTCPVCGNLEARGDQCDNCGTYLNQTELINPRSKITGNKPVVRPTKHWYFKLSAFQGDLEKFIESHAGKWRDTVIQQARSWLKAGLHDRPITRDLDWGVPVPIEGSEGKVLYVWFDAPVGYVTATKELLPNDWKKWWTDDENLEWVCFLGKDNIVFHTIMFPAMEMGVNKSEVRSLKSEVNFKLKLPTQVPANEFMNLEGRKLSKSRGWTIEPHEILERYDSDLIRYSIACNLPESKDSDFSWKDFQAHTNNELADIFGNFANRVLTFVKNNFDGKVPNGKADSEFLSGLGDHAKLVAERYEKFQIREATNETMEFARMANKYFNDAAPWKLIKSDREAAASILLTCLETLRAMSIYFRPIIPIATAKIDAMLGVRTALSWDEAHKAMLQAGSELGEISILFSKLEDEQIAGELQSLQKMSEQFEKAASPVVVNASPAESVQITIDDFKRIKLKTATVLEAERVPKSKKLLKLQIEIGQEKRQIVAGIAEKYAPEDLVGKTIVVVANLAPAKLMGIESQGMLLAVNDDKGPVALVTPMSDSASGLEVR